MFGSKPSQRATEYATCKDFQQIFNEDMAGLHLLAYLLTADPARAEQCFVAGLEESIHGNPVFKQWARGWSKRAIIRNAIKTLAPAIGRGGAPEAAVRSASEHPLVRTVTAWAPFERFVFVMSVLEGYSLRECSTLLACSVQDVITAKSQVLQRLAEQPAQAAAASALGHAPWNALFARAHVA
jgi:DNA-directed RNA polymerase specialized sigma24 family protein